MRAFIWTSIVTGSLGVLALLVWDGLDRQPREDTSGRDSLSIGSPRQFKNLTIFPVVSVDARNADNYITLDEGLAAGSVRVLEVGAAPPAASAPANAPAAPVANQANDDPFAGGANVNQLQVVNASSKPLYLMPGEIFVGGKQDRTLGESLVIANDGRPVEVSVFCVEHGRWGLRGTAETVNLALTISNSSADSNQADELAKKAADGQMVASGGTLGKGLRQQVNRGADQGQVWQDVAALNSKSGCASASCAFSANYVDPGVQQKVEPYLADLQHSIAATERIVGIVVAVNGHIELADVFESTPLFCKLWPKLLKSCALDAMLTADEATSSTCSPADALAFLRESQAAGVEKTEQHPGTVFVTRDSAALTSFGTCAAATVAEPQAAIHEPAIHIATFAK